jgi:peptidoglycan/xylan/chitin deacetylase (PgdA/CDA1 family)
MLERHIEWLAKRYSLVSLDEIGAHLQSPRGFRKPPAAITFDDGYRDVYYHGFPVLKRMGIPAAVFVVTGIVGTGLPQIFDRLYLSLRHLHSRGIHVARVVNGVSRTMGIDLPFIRSDRGGDEAFRIMRILIDTLSRGQTEKLLEALESGLNLSSQVIDELKPLDWDMIRSMVREGMTIGSHTKSHMLLTSESPETARIELNESRRTLESKLGRTTQHLAYPDGRFNPAVVEAAHSAGYRYAYGICRARDERFPLLTIPRKVMWELSCLDALNRFSPAVMNCHANWAFQRRDCSAHDHYA